MAWHLTQEQSGLCSCQREVPLRHCAATQFLGACVGLHCATASRLEPLLLIVLHCHIDYVELLEP